MSSRSAVTDEVPTTERAAFELWRASPPRFERGTPGLGIARRSLVPRRVQWRCQRRYHRAMDSNKVRIVAVALVSLVAGAALGAVVAYSGRSKPIPRSDPHRQ